MKMGFWPILCNWIIISISRKCHLVWLLITVVRVFGLHWWQLIFIPTGKLAPARSWLQRLFYRSLLEESVDHRLDYQKLQQKLYLSMANYSLVRKLILGFHYIYRRVPLIYCRGKWRWHNDITVVSYKVRIFH